MVCCPPDRPHPFPRASHTPSRSSTGGRDLISSPRPPVELARGLWEIRRQCAMTTRSMICCVTTVRPCVVVKNERDSENGIIFLGKIRHMHPHIVVVPHAHNTTKKFYHFSKARCLFMHFSITSIASRVLIPNPMGLSLDGLYTGAGPSGELLATANLRATRWSVTRRLLATTV